MIHLCFTCGVNLVPKPPHTGGIAWCEDCQRAGKDNYRSAMLEACKKVEAAR